ncbi:phage Gp37/Gp68 family protein [Nonomuraea angiospora]|uniref:DUF5131 family protein n=1 Tax=Nonomuraea angiospora TaxID=46172 RepID=UPI00344E8D6E
MSDNSTIEWLNKPGYKPATWNPTIGCKRVSPGCDNCYPIPLARIREANPNPKIAAAFAGVVEHTGDRLDWTGQVNILPDRLDTPLHWRKPRMVFVNSLSDLFHGAIPAEFIARVFAVMAQTPQHLYVILTKRHARMRALLTDVCRCGVGHPPGTHFRSAVAWASTSHSPTYVPGLNGSDVHQAWPLRNVILGVSVENQQWADIRIPALLETPAAVWCISAEPLLGSIVLREDWLGVDPYRRDEPSLSWIITGGESGSGARPPHPDWFRSLRDQAKAAGVPFFFKQHGEWAPSGAVGIGRSPARHALIGDPVDEQGHRIEMVRLGKHQAGAVLDGRTWTEYPDA